MTRPAPLPSLALLGTARAEPRDADREWIESWTSSAASDFAATDESAPGLQAAWRVRGPTSESGSLGRSDSGSHGVVLAGRIEAPGSRSDAFANALADDASKAFDGAAGPCVGVAFSSPERSATLFRPDCGQRPLCYAPINHGVAFASDARTLTTHPEIGATTHWASVAEYLAFGLVWGEKTLFEDVRRLAPGARVEVSNGAMRRVAPRWKFRESPKGDGACLDLIDASLHESVARAHAGAARPTICLSAGLDSRTLLAVAHKQGLELRCVTDCVEGSIEFEYASRMCDAIGAEHIRRVLEEDATDTLLDGAATVIRCTDGEGSIQNSIMLDSGAHYGGDFDIDRVVRGHGGELLKMSMAYDFALPEAISQRGDATAARDFIIRRMMREYDEAALGALRGELADAMRGNVGAAFDEAWEASADEAPDPTQRAGLLFLRAYNTRTTSNSMNCMRQSVDVAMPFLDEQFAIPLLSTPPKLRHTTALQVELIRRNSKRLLDVPDGILRVALGAPRWQRRLARIARALDRRLGLGLLGEIDVPEKWVVRRLETLLPEILLQERSLARPHVDPDGMRALVASAHANAGDARVFMNRMCSLEYHLRCVESFEDAPGAPLPAARSNGARS